VGGVMNASSSAFLTQLRRIPGEKGAVWHGLKKSDAGFAGFGEAYFSVVGCGAVKGWKKHTRMTMNLIVVAGAIRFVLGDDRDPSAGSVPTTSFLLTAHSDEGYARLTVPPGYWMAFQGIGPGDNMLLNVASIEHDPTEAESRDLAQIPWPW
jgi:dTDP-4-dehydrorhamnose 3,5-epimerase